MPVSHIGLTVSHIPTATSFYQAALQPLGYRFIGHQGNSIGFGVDSADFFLTQAPMGTRSSPNHIAFLAGDRNVVRDCYSASLNAGGHPSGAPNYRNSDCSCFNAAVEDHDGNTIEFIFRQPHGENGCCEDSQVPSDPRVLAWQENVASSDVEEDDAMTVARSVASNVPRTKSRMSAALDLAKSTSASLQSVAPSQRITRTNTAPAGTGFGSKTMIGVALGAAAGAALLFATTREESKNAKAEARHLASMSPQAKSQRRRSVPSAYPPPPPRSEDRFRHTRHNYGTTDSATSRPHPKSTQAMRMIEATGYNANDDNQGTLSRYTHLRPHPTRSRTQDAIDYAPKYLPARSQSTHAPSRGIRRATTLPADADLNYREPLLLDAPRASKSRSRYSDRDSAVSGRHSKPRSHRRTSADNGDHLKRHDSGVSMYSASRSQRDRGNDAGGRRSSAIDNVATQPPRRESEQGALPPPPIGCYAPKPKGGEREGSRAPSTCYFPAAIALPPSSVGRGPKATTKRGDRAPLSAKQVPRSVRREHDTATSSSVLQSWEDFEASEDSDGLGDVKTLVPEDSISCVDLTKPRKSKSGSHHGSRHPSSRRSEASSQRTIRPAKERGSLLGLPIRRRN